MTAVQGIQAAESAANGPGDPEPLPAAGPGSGGFVRPVVAAIAPLIGLLDERLAGIAGPTGLEREVVQHAARQSLVQATLLKLNRVLLLELHAAALAGQLAGADERQRWSEFLDLAATAEFRDRLWRRYPSLHDRIDAAGRYQIAALCTLVERLHADRGALAGLATRPLGALRSLWLNAGDTHRGGQAVARLDFDGGTVMYKPRPLEVEAALDRLLAALLPGPDRIRTPRILVRDGYGWTSFVRQRYCRDSAQCALFYRNLGRWLAVMRLLGGIDLHADNVIADGPVPVVIDGETLFAPVPPVVPTASGAAMDAATAVQRRAVLRTGILPMRVGVLSGLDLSAAGKLPGQQPLLRGPAIAGAGTDGAHLALAPGEIRPSANHPAADPAPERFWEHVVRGFQELSGQLRRIDARGGLPDLLRAFLGCQVRQVRRSTRVYGDLRRMLWHPASLHRQQDAVRRARAVLHRHAVTTPGAPTDQSNVDAEIAELLVDDVPVFELRVDQSRIDAAVGDWRRADLATEARLIRFALAGAFHDGLPTAVRRQPTDSRARAPGGRGRGSGSGSGSGNGRGRGDGFDRGGGRRRGPDERRELAAAGVRELRDTAIRGADGTAAWLGPVPGEAGWAVRPLPAELYSGQSGVAVCLAGYLRESRAGRADPVDGLDDLLDAALATLRATEDATRLVRAGDLSGQVFTWCALARLLGRPNLLDRARERAALLKLRPADNARAEVLGGVAGVVMPMLALAEATGDQVWLAAAAAAGGRLAQTVVVDDRGARWPATGFPDGTSGFGYGSAGIGWALARLAGSRAGTEERRGQWRVLAGQAFQFAAQGHQPAAEASGPAVDRPQLRASWCRGSVGPGLAAADLYLRTGEPGYLRSARRAAESAVRDGFGWGRTLCHGDCGTWELLDTMRSIDDGRPDDTLSNLDQQLVRSLARPPAGGAGGIEAGAPGLFTGLAGVVHTLLRMHPEHELCAPLLLDPQPSPPGRR